MRLAANHRRDQVARVVSEFEGRADYRRWSRARAGHCVPLDDLWSRSGSKINEFEPYKRIGWYGYAPGATPTFYHTWLLTPIGDTCRVITDEVGMGKDAAHLRETDESLMHRGHDLWLATLKWMSEGSAPAR